MRSNICSNIWINDYECVNSKKLSRKYSRLFHKLGIVLSHCALFIIMTLSMRFIRAKSNENISSADISQAMFIYRVNYMLDLNTYYIPIFMHTAICAILYSCLMNVTFDVLYLTMIGNCCGFFAATRWVLRNSIDLRYPELNIWTCENIRWTDTFLPFLVKFRIFLFISFLSVASSVHFNAWLMQQLTFSFWYIKCHSYRSSNFSYCLKHSLSLRLREFVTKYLISTFASRIELYIHQKHNKASVKTVFLPGMRRKCVIKCAPYQRPLCIHLFFRVILTAPPV